LRDLPCKFLWKYAFQRSVKSEWEFSTLACLKTGECLPQGPTATVGIFVDSGSAYETPETTGASHLLEYLAFKSTTNRTSFRITRELEGLGANVVASASREQVSPLAS